MKIYYSLDEMTRQPNTIVTVGTFDGLHLGHQAILTEVSTRAASVGGRSVVITFDPHPREIVGRGQTFYLTTMYERLEWINHQHIDETLILKFTYEFSRLTPRDFYEKTIVGRVGVREVIVGHDHMFGRDRKAGFDELQKIGHDHGFAARAVPPVSVNGTVISSSLIRKTLQKGEVGLAAQYLGRPYSISGIVVKGDDRGNELGFPTANIRPTEPNKLIPASGVYVVRGLLEQKRLLYGMLNIGVRPTFETNHNQVIEVHFFDFNEVLYNRTLQVHFLKRLRSERQFSSKDELIVQLRNDQQISKKYISEMYQP